MKTVVRPFLSVAASVAMIASFATASQSSATTATSDAKSCSVQAAGKAGATDLSQVKGQKSRGLIEAVSSAVKNGKISTHAPQAALSLQKAKVYSVNTDGPAYTSVTVPISGEYSMVSNLTVIFDGKGKIVKSGETLISKNDAGNFNISNFTGGKLVKSNDTDRPFMSDAQLQQKDPDKSAGPVLNSTHSTGSTVACVVSVLGVSGAVGYLIVGACAGACTVPIVGTAICVACIGAYAAVGGASITAVASCF